MKTISKCFLYIAIMCPLGLADLYFALYGIGKGNWIVTSLNIIAIIILVFAIRSAYKTAKGYEKILCDAISDLQLRNTIMELNGFCELIAKETKDKEDEVPTDK